MLTSLKKKKKIVQQENFFSISYMFMHDKIKNKKTKENEKVKSKKIQNAFT